ncbi:MAG: hypothetical protein ACC707_16345 [Thiohalomonadales bacterium]
MKNKLISTVCILVIIGLFGCDGKIDTTSTDLIQPDYAYEFDGWGSNPDVYEFTPKSNKNYSCVYVISGADSDTTLFCIPKPK